MSDTVDTETFDFCEICHNRGWIPDDISPLLGGRSWRYCHCKHGRILAKEDYKRAPRYKTCPQCGGSGKIKEEEK